VVGEDRNRVRNSSSGAKAGKERYILIKLDGGRKPRGGGGNKHSQISSESVAIRKQNGKGRRAEMQLINGKKFLGQTGGKSCESFSQNEEESDRLWFRRNVGKRDQEELR